MQVAVDKPARLLCGGLPLAGTVRLADGTEGVYIGALGSGQHQVETAAGTRIVSRQQFERSER